MQMRLAWLRHPSFLSQEASRLSGLAEVLRERKNRHFSCQSTCRQQPLQLMCSDRDGESERSALHQPQSWTLRPKTPRKQMAFLPICQRHFRSCRLVNWYSFFLLFKMSSRSRHTGLKIFRPSSGAFLLGSILFTTLHL